MPKRHAGQEGDIAVRLTHDEALVLSEWLDRLQNAGLRPLVEHGGEVVAIGALVGRLDELLAELFDPRYRDLVVAARSRLVEGYEPDPLEGL
ncbi:MAG: hypothetical protein E6J14_02000 [Chloroflexi bacterium]|nr:MAG: hypothetical protein E6J14_02000 [Chloroflexota bacterium]